MNKLYLFLIGLGFAIMFIGAFVGNFFAFVENLMTIPNLGCAILLFGLTMALGEKPFTKEDDKMMYFMSQIEKRLLFLVSFIFGMGVFVYPETMHLIACGVFGLFCLVSLIFSIIGYNQIWKHQP